MNTIDPITKLSFSIYENKGVYALLLGSGISRSAGIPTGWEITLDLIKRVAQANGVTDVTNWEAWYKETKQQDPSYSNILEELASTSSERRSILNTYIEPIAGEISEKKKVPTDAHYAIAELVSKGFIKVIITTNFDQLLESALKEKGITPTVVASVDALKGAEPLAHSQCYILKLHGDYKDKRILNTEDELATYPDEYQSLLARIFDEYGLIVCGWSGEWDEALRSELLKVVNRRYSTFWTTLNTPTDRATALINHRKAQIIEIENADTFFTKVNEQVQILETTQRENPASLSLLKSTVKRYLSKPDEYKIQLEDLMHIEMDQLIQTTNTEEFIRENKNFPTGELLLASIERYNAISERLVLIAGMIGRWGNEPLPKTILEAFYHSVEDAFINGRVEHRRLQYYPLGLIYTAYGIGLVKAKNWKVLGQLLQHKVVPYNNYPRCFSEVILEKIVASKLFKELPHHTKTKTFFPYEDYLYDLFSSQFDTSIYGLKSEFEELFGWFELYQAMSNHPSYFGRCTYANTQKYQMALKRPEIIDTFIKAGLITDSSDPKFNTFVENYKQSAPFAAFGFYSL